MNRREGCSSTSRDDSSTTSATAATPSSPSLDHVSARAPRPILRRTLVSARRRAVAAPRALLSPSRVTATLVALLRVDTPPESTSRASARVFGAPRALERVRIIPFARRALVPSSRRLVVPSIRGPARRITDRRARRFTASSASPTSRMSLDRRLRARLARAARPAARSSLTPSLIPVGRRHIATSHRADATPTATSRDEDLEG